MQPRDLFLSPDDSSRDALEFLTGHGFKDARQADRHLQRIAEQVGLPERLADLSPSLLAGMTRAVDPDVALLHLSSFFEAVPNPLNLVAYLGANPAALEVLLQTLGASPFLAQLLFRNPEYFYWLMESGRLDRAEGTAYFEQQARDLTRPFPDLDAALDSLRRLRRRETLRIGVQDLLGRVSLRQTVEQISDLAGAILERTFQRLAREMGPSQGFAVLALGKLGGRELNFSSDIDLLYLYRHEQQREGMLRLARELTRVLGEHTAEGRLYRVDLRLRPSGKSGEIAYPLAAARQYYETWADTFDRLALIKARWIAGDAALGREFLQGVEGFVYKRYLDVAAVEEIRWLKRRIDREMALRWQDRNIKFGLGGIREIEFFVQAFQLLNGGCDPQIRSPNTLQALDRLVDVGLISLDDHSTLQEGYIFLRNLEHKLQLVHDLQTHSLPRDPEQLLSCARRMGYRDDLHEGRERTAVQCFIQELESRGQAVNRVFDSLFESEEKPMGLEALVLNPELDRESALALIRAERISPAQEFYEGIALLQQAASFPHSPSRMRNLLANLVARMAVPAALTPEPRALFTRLDRFCESLGSRAPLYSELVENPDFARRFFTLLSAGDFLSETLIRNPELLDSLSQLPQPRTSSEELKRVLQLEQASRRDPRDGLRLFKRREEFKAGLLDLFQFPALQTRHRLTRLAEVCLEWTLARLQSTLSDLERESFALFALGKLGGAELTYHSDLDLMLVFDDRRSRGSELRFGDLLRHLRDELALFTDLGRAYRLDFRLRPEGKQGPLAVPASYLIQYFKERAQPWERLAYVKLRPLTPAAGLPWKNLIWDRPLSREERLSLRHVRRRQEVEIGAERRSAEYNFKVGSGGLMDIQFVVQYLQLQHGIREPSTAAACRRLMEAGHLEESTGEALLRGLDFLFALESIRRLLCQNAGSTLPRAADENRMLARLLGFASGEALLDRFSDERTRIRQIYQRFFE